MAVQLRPYPSPPPLSLELNGTAIEIFVAASLREAAEKLFFLWAGP